MGSKDTAAPPPGPGADERRGGPGDAPEAGDAADGAIPGFVLAALAELRARNALAIAWIHVSVRLALGAVLTWAALATSLRLYSIGAAINAGFLAGAVAVLALLQRRWATPWVIRALILMDLASLTLGGWRFTHTLPPPQAAVAAGMLVALAQLVLISAGLILAGRDLVAVGLAVSLLTVWWCELARVPPPFSLMLVVAVLGFGAVVIWAARRIVRLAIQESLVAYSARTFRMHRDELDAANRRIRESQEQAERLTQLVVHDLKNPLAVVLAHLSLVHRTLSAMPELAEEAEDLRIARDEGTRLAGMIGDLLLVSRLETGELQVRPECVDLGTALGQVARGLRAVSAAKGVGLEVAVAPGLVAPLDPGLFRRLLENLVANALRHTRQGDRIEMAAWAEGADLRVAVRNTGPAVSRAIRARLFEKHAADGRGEWHNVGLGLYTCRLVAEAHGGRIALADRPGWSVSFEAAIPSARCPLGRRGADGHLGVGEEEREACTQLLRNLPC
jgi:signal transduction histidine kinase